MKAMLIVVLTGLLFLSTLAYTFSRVEDPAFLSDQARSVNLYGRLSSKLETLLPKEGDQKSFFNPTEMAEIITATIDGGTFYGFLDGSLGAVLPWLPGKSETFAYRYDLAELKNKATTTATQKALFKYQALPLCKSDQLRGWEIDGSLPSCRLTDRSLDDQEVERLLAVQVGKSFEQLPAELSIGPNEKLLKIRSIVSTADKAVKVIWLVTALFLAGYLLIFRRRALLTLAIVFLVVGLLQIGFSLVAWDYLTRTIAESFANKADSTVLPIVVDMVGVGLQVLKTILGNLSIFFLAGGGALLLVSIISRFRKPPAV